MLTNHNHNLQHFFPFFRFRVIWFFEIDRFKNWNLFEDNTTKCQFKANYCSVSIIDFQILTPYNCLFPSWHSFIFIGVKVDSLKILKNVPYGFCGYWYRQHTRHTLLKLIPSTLTLKASFKLICMILYDTLYRLSMRLHFEENTTAFLVIHLTVVWWCWNKLTNHIVGK